MSGASCCGDLMSARSSFDVPDSRRQSLELGASGSHVNALGIRDQLPPLMSPISETSCTGFEASGPSTSEAMQERRASLSLHLSSSTSAVPSTTKSEAKLQRSATTNVRREFQRTNSPRLIAPGTGPVGVVKRTRVTKPLWLKKRQTASVDIPDLTAEPER